MKRRTKTALGIHVAETCVSVALVERRRGDVQTIAAATADLPRADATDTRPQRAAVVSHTIAKVRRSAPRCGLKAGLATSDGSILTQLLDIPSPMPGNVGEFVHGELKQYVPLAGKDTVSDFCATGTGTDRAKRLLVAAAEEGQIAAEVELCGSTSSLLEVVEPAILSYARGLLASAGRNRAGENSLVALLGERHLVVALFRHGAPDFIRRREVPAGAEGPEAICRWVTQELVAVVRYAGSHAPSESAAWRGWLVLTGGPCTREQIVSATNDATGLQSLVVSDERQACAESTGSQDELGAKASPVAVGAAMGVLDAESGNRRINLLPEKVRKTRSVAKRVLVAVNVAVLTFLAGFLTTQVLAQVAGTMRDRIEQKKIAERTYATSALIAQEKHLDRELTRLEREITGLHAMLTRRDVDWPAVLEAVGRAVPAGVSITRVASTGPRALAVHGTMLTAEAAQAFAQTLQERGPFASVSLSRIRGAEQDGDMMEYELACVFEDGR